MNIYPKETFFLKRKISWVFQTSVTFDNVAEFLNIAFSKYNKTWKTEKQKFLNLADFKNIAIEFYLKLDYIFIDLDLVICGIPKDQILQTIAISPEKYFLEFKKNPKMFVKTTKLIFDEHLLNFDFYF